MSTPAPGLLSGIGTMCWPSSLLRLAQFDEDFWCFHAYRGCFAVYRRIFCGFPQKIPISNALLKEVQQTASIPRHRNNGPVRCSISRRAICAGVNPSGRGPFGSAGRKRISGLPHGSWSAPFKSTTEMHRCFCFSPFSMHRFPWINSPARQPLRIRTGSGNRNAMATPGLIRVRIYI